MVLSLKCLLRINAKPQNEAISDSAECSGLRINERLPARDAFVLRLISLVPSPPYRTPEKTDRGKPRRGSRAGEKVGGPNTQRIRVELSNGAPSTLLTRGYRHTLRSFYPQGPVLSSQLPCLLS